MRQKAFAGATRTTSSSSNVSAGSRARRFQSVWRRRTPGSTTSWRQLRAPLVGLSHPVDVPRAPPAAGAGPVISVIVYGRNDAHGYNLHRRAALSLNCIAEVLDDPDDEIVFVDYNTPDELPTFVEALADTLTDRCLGMLRVLRVPAEIHKQRFAARTHLAAVEPVARNAGVRRANPSNRWLLSTNTDMIFLPQSDLSLSEICSKLLN